MNDDVMDREIKIRVDEISEVFWAIVPDKRTMDAYKNDEDGIFTVTLDSTSGDYPEYHEGRKIKTKFDGHKIPTFVSFVDKD